MEKARKRLFVSRVIQGRMLRHVAVYWLIYHVFLWHTLFLADGLRGGESLPFVELYAKFLAEHFLLLACGLAVLPMVLWDMLKLTHRAAGPFVRFEQALKEMSQGKQTAKLKLRKNDLVTEFLAVFNDFIEYHNRTVEAKTADAASPCGFTDTTGDLSDGQKRSDTMLVK